MRQRIPVPVVLSVADATAALLAAEAAAERWDGAAEEKTREAERLAADLAEAEALAGENVIGFEGDEDFVDDAQIRARISDITDRLARARAEQAVAARAADAAKAQLGQGRRGVLRARAEVLRARVAELRGVVAERQARTDRMLAELSTWERTPFAPIVEYSASGGGTQRRTLTQIADGRATWLHDQALELDRLADVGNEAEVLQAIRRAMPERIEVEDAVLPTPAKDVESTNA